MTETPSPNLCELIPMEARDKLERELREIHDERFKAANSDDQDADYEILMILMRQVYAYTFFGLIGSRRGEALSANSDFDVFAYNDRATGTSTVYGGELPDVLRNLRSRLQAWVRTPTPIQLPRDASRTLQQAVERFKIRRVSYVPRKEPKVRPENFSDAAQQCATVPLVQVETRHLAKVDISTSFPALLNTELVCAIAKHQKNFYAALNIWRFVTENLHIAKTEKQAGFRNYSIAIIQIKALQKIFQLPLLTFQPKMEFDPKNIHTSIKKLVLLQSTRALLPLSIYNIVIEVCKFLNTPKSWQHNWLLVDNVAYERRETPGRLEIEEAYESLYDVAIRNIFRNVPPDYFDKLRQQAGFIEEQWKRRQNFDIRVLTTNPSASLPMEVDSRPHYYSDPELNDSGSSEEEEGEVDRAEPDELWHFQPQLAIHKTAMSHKDFEKYRRRLANTLTHHEEGISCQHLREVYVKMWHRELPSNKQFCGLTYTEFLKVYEGDILDMFANPKRSGKNTDPLAVKPSRKLLTYGDEDVEVLFMEISGGRTQRNIVFREDENPGTSASASDQQLEEANHQDESTSETLQENTSEQREEPYSGEVLPTDEPSKLSSSVPSVEPISAPASPISSECTATASTKLLSALDIEERILTTQEEIVEFHIGQSVMPIIRRIAVKLAKAPLSEFERLKEKNKFLKRFRTEFSNAVSEAMTSRPTETPEIATLHKLAPDYIKVFEKQQAIINRTFGIGASQIREERPADLSPSMEPPPAKRAHCEPATHGDIEPITTATSSTVATGRAQAATYFQPTPPMPPPGPVQPPPPPPAAEAAIFLNPSGPLTFSDCFAFVSNSPDELAELHKLEIDAIAEEYFQFFSSTTEYDPTESVGARQLKSQNFCRQVSHRLQYFRKVPCAPSKNLAYLKDLQKKSQMITARLKAGIAVYLHL